MTASASVSGGSITNVTFKANSQVIGSSTTSPYSILWSNIAAGTYTVTATALDNTGHSATSAPITVKVSKSVKGVRGGKNSTQTINNAISATLPSLAEDAGQTSALQTLVASLDQTYSDFVDERAMFPSAKLIDKYLFAASFLARSGAGLSEEQTPSAGVIDRLKKINSYLSFCEDLMVDGVISSSTVTTASRVNAQVNLSMYQPETSPVGTLGFNVMPNGTARISSLVSNPFSTQSATASGGGLFEVADVSVTVGGEAARILTVSPTELTVVVPSALNAGLAEIVVTSREGFILHGGANVAGLHPTILAPTGDSSGRGVAVDPVSMRSGSFSVTPSFWIGLDARTRLAILATGISSGLPNTDVSNDIWLSNGQVIENLAEGVSVEARTADGRVFSLPVEYAGAQGQLRGVDQVNIVLVPELSGQGTIQITIIAGGVRSNTMTISVN